LQFPYVLPTSVDSGSHNLARLLDMSRLIHAVDIGANPIDGAPPYRPLLEAQLCRIAGFEPQASALAELNLRKGPNETYFPYAATAKRTPLIFVPILVGPAYSFPARPPSTSLVSSRTMLASWIERRLRHAASTI
jgi:hypothetical protein